MSGKMEILSKEFLSPNKHASNPMHQLGAFVYSRTYSRYLPHLGRREFWWETVRRAVEYNCSLAPTTREEAESLAPQHLPNETVSVWSYPVGG